MVGLVYPTELTPENRAIDMECKVVLYTRVKQMVTRKQVEDQIMYDLTQFS